MEDPVKGAGRMITDASGVTTREGGISSTGSTMFKDNNGIKASRPPQIPDIRDILDVFPQSLRESLVNKISDAIDYEPIIGVMGKTGAGKSSVCNALFQGEVCAVSDVEACTREAQELRIRFGKRSLKIIDIPGVGENALRDKEYEDLYRTLLPSLDLILWVIKGDDRAFSADEHFYNNVLLPADGGERVLFVLNQVDKIEPFREWDTHLHQPSPAQRINIGKKEAYITERFGFTHYPVIPISADEGYNILRLVETMIRALPDRAKSSTASQFKEEFKTEEVKTEAKGGFASVLSGILDDVIDSVPLPGPVKELARKGKDKVIEWASNAWDYFFG
ncbi:GTPase [Enterobacter hormaechei subsp. steigerwaltii]|uniref:GTPase family protein n=1 Tax=Enterobacter hormaechei TaxID=158836 RepID=UPI000735DBC1|nr:GTPase [Enterobacter hormaechei]KTJ32458.1 GTPase [Enterobacter hormaechei subsp. steigerwaltii]